MAKNKRKNQIWKLQRPLFGTEGVLSYTENRENMAIINMSEDDLDMLFGDELKIYVIGHSNGTDLVVDKIIEDQWW